MGWVGWEINGLIEYIVMLNMLNISLIDLGGLVFVLYFLEFGLLLFVVIWV